MKPGYKSTEFWMKSTVAVAGIVMASGVLVEGSELFKIVGMVISLGAALGYTAARTKAKMADDAREANDKVAEARASDPRRP